MRKWGLKLLLLFWRNRKQTFLQSMSALGWCHLCPFSAIVLRLGLPHFSLVPFIPPASRRNIFCLFFTSPIVSLLCALIRFCPLSRHSWPCINTWVFFLHCFLLCLTIGSFSFSFKPSVLLLGLSCLQAGLFSAFHFLIWCAWVYPDFTCSIHPVWALLSWGAGAVDLHPSWLRLFQSWHFSPFGSVLE